MSKSAETRSRIADTSSRLEDVLLRLLTEIDNLHEGLENEIQYREKDIAGVKDVIRTNLSLVKDALDKEKW